MRPISNLSDSLILRQQNRSDPEYEPMFNGLMTEVFGFSFAPWHRLGLWGEDYECHSLIEGGRMIANASISKMDLLVNGRRYRVHQFGAVAVRPDRRGRGLARRLMSHILDSYPGVPSFLLANEDVLDFYPQFGFQRLSEHRPVLETAIDNDLQPKRLTVDDPFLAPALRGRGLFSQVLDRFNADSILMFHLLFDGREVFQLPGGELVITSMSDGETLFLADVVSSRPVSFAEIKGGLPFSGVRRVEFGFCPDHLGLEPQWEEIVGDETPLFVRGDLVWPRVFRIPVMAVT